MVKGKDQIEITKDIIQQSPSAALRMLKRWLRESDIDIDEQLPSERALCSKLNVPRYSMRVAIKVLEEQGWLRKQGRKRFLTQLGDVPAIKTAAMGAVVILSEPHHMTFDQLGPGSLWYIDAGADQALGELGIKRLAMDPAQITVESMNQLIVERPRGIITFRDKYKHRPTMEILNQFKKVMVPIVIYGYGPELDDFDTISSNQEEGTYLLTQAMIERGCKRILRYWELRMDGEQDPAWLRLRDKGYKRAMKEAGLEPLPALRCHEVPYLTNNRDKFNVKVRATAGNLVEVMLDRHMIDGIQTISDRSTFSIAAAIRLFGLEPNIDIYVAGYDNYWENCNERIWEPSIPLATVDKRNFEMGQELARLLTDRIDGKLGDVPQHRKIAPRVVFTDDIDKFNFGMN